MTKEEKLKLTDKPKIGESGTLCRPWWSSAKIKYVFGYKLANIDDLIDIEKSKITKLPVEMPIVVLKINHEERIVCLTPRGIFEVHKSNLKFNL